jgi:adenine-specific DNA-methyltransferase
MKYMGSKRWMLGNGLGHVLTDRAKHAERFVDLFSGTAAVAWHVAENSHVPVLAVDLQTYSSVFAGAVLRRTEAFESSPVLAAWKRRALTRCRREAIWNEAQRFVTDRLDVKDVSAARQLCADSAGLITRAYGGYYFSPTQAVMFDALLKSLPREETHRVACLTALLWAMTRCVASPGHTAQPFQPTPTALPFICTAWKKDPWRATSEVLPSVSARAAKRLGVGVVADATWIAEREVTERDLVFLDPPYSAAQYSRFYHVLETAARESCGEVRGEGRYPPPSERPRSDFSLVSKARASLDRLMTLLGNAGCEVVMTFPQHRCSNGLVGEDIVDMARKWFLVDVRPVVTRHSTLGGNNDYRASRRSSLELIMVMRPH